MRDSESEILALLAHFVSDVGHTTQYEGPRDKNALSQVVIKEHL